MGLSASIDIKSSCVVTVVDMNKDVNIGVSLDDINIILITMNVTSS